MSITACLSVKQQRLDKLGQPHPDIYWNLFQYHLKDTDWHFVSINPQQQDTWHQSCCKYIFIGNTRHTPQEIKIAPGMITSGPEQFILWLHCFYPSLFLPKGQIVAQAVLVLNLPEGTENKSPQLSGSKLLGRTNPKSGEMSEEVGSQNALRCL